MGNNDERSVGGRDDTTLVLSEIRIDSGNAIGRLDFKTVEKCLDDQFNSGNINKSVICDIIAMYLKGQKILYTEAKTVCEMRMNCLMLPAILITSLASILSLVLKEYEFGSTLVSSLNGINAFLLALISYLKLDAKAEAHRTTSYKFDKLQSNLEFSSGKNMFLDMSFDDMIKIINETENNVREIKETNQFILPEKIRYGYPKLCNINVFAEVKKIQNEEMLAVNELKDIMNELAPFMTRDDITLTADEKTLKRELNAKQKDITSKIIAMKDDYLLIDDQFDAEMEVQRMKSRRGCNPLAWLKT
jgi:hypothetical protein